MLTHYIRIALINIKKEKFYSSLNIFGLAIGFACFIIIALFILQEFNIDKGNSYSENVYRVSLKIDVNHIQFKGVSTSLNTGVSEYLNSGIPGIMRSTAFMGNWEGLFSNRKEAYEETGLYMVDSNFFEVFSIPFISGSAHGFMGETKVILTEKYAHKYFGDEEAVGKEILWGNSPYLVSGVVPDPPKNSRIQYSILLPITLLNHYHKDNWQNGSFATYIKTNGDFHPKAQTLDLNQYCLKRIAPLIKSTWGIELNDLLKEGNVYHYFFEPCKDLYLHSEGKDNFGAVGRIKVVYIFGLIAILILLLASINYINLSIAKSVKRLKEIALRKSIGASKKQIISQYLIESVIIGICALFIGLVFVELSIPIFNSFKIHFLEFKMLFQSGLFSVILLIAIIIGLLSGSFPAFILARFNTIDGLKGISQARTKGRWFRRSLILIQLVISFLIISATFIIDNQLDYLTNKDLGFDSDKLLYIKNANALYLKSETSKQELLKNENIEAISFSNINPGQIMGNFTAQIEGRPADQLANITYIYADADYMKTFGLQLQEGRFLNKDIKTDSLAFVVNETLLKEYDIENPLTTGILRPGEKRGEKERYSIVGVVKDFHYGNLYNHIRPMIISTNLPQWAGNMYVRIKGRDIPGTIQHIEKYWNEINPTTPFLYSFFSQTYNAAYQQDKDTKQIFLIFAVIAILIACFGLIGLVSYASLLKRKEIGVRKVNGASSVQIAVLLSKETLLIATFSIIVSIPIGMHYMRLWLDSFAYCINISLLHYMLPAFVLLIISFLAEAFVIINTARQKPVIALKYE